MSTFTKKCNIGGVSNLNVRTKRSHFPVQLTLPLVSGINNVAAGFYQQNLSRNSLDETRKVELGRDKAPLPNLPAGLPEGSLDICLCVEVGPRGLGGAREQLPNSLKQVVVECLGSEAEDQPLLGEGDKVGNHPVGLALGIVYQNVQAHHRVVLPVEALEVLHLELGHHVAVFLSRPDPKLLFCLFPKKKLILSNIHGVGGELGK